MDLDFFIRDANNISSSSPKHLRRRDVDFSLSTHVLFARLQVLSSHIVVVVDVVGDFTECVGMEIFRFYGMDVGCVSRDMRCSLFFLKGHGTIVDFLGNMASIAGDDV